MNEYTTKEGITVTEYDFGLKRFVFDNQLHREDGPAIEYENGDKSFYKNGKLHRLDGPAIDWRHIKEWWVEGTRYFKVIDEDFLIINGEKFLSVDKLTKIEKE